MEYLISCSVIDITMLDQTIFKNKINIAISIDSTFSKSSIEIQPSAGQHYNYIESGTFFPIIELKYKFNDGKNIIYIQNMIGIILQGIKHTLDFCLLKYNDVNRQVLPAINEILNTFFDDFILDITKLQEILESEKESCDTLKNNHYETEIVFLITNIRLLQQTVEKKISNFYKIWSASEDMRDERNENGSSLRDIIEEGIQIVQSIYDHLSDLQSKLESLWPDLKIWILNNKTRAAYFTMKAEDIIYNDVKEMCGKYCGRVQNILMKPVQALSNSDNINFDDFSIVAKMEVILWLGESKERQICYDNFPSWFTLSSNENNAGEQTFQLLNKSAFQCKVHISRGHFPLENYDDGLDKPFVRIIFGHLQRDTKVVKGSNFPVWNETLILDYLYCSRDKIFDEPPIVIVEAYNYDTEDGENMIGRSCVIPLVQLHDKTIKESNPQWCSFYKQFSEYKGKILLSIEMHEISKMQLAGLKIFEKISLAESKLHSHHSKHNRYRLDAYIWGIRKLERVKFYPRKITRIKVKIEINGCELNSSVLKIKHKCGNFKGGRMRMNFYSEDMSSASICVKLICCKSFGRESCCGDFVIKDLTPYIFKWQSFYECRNSLLTSDITDEDFFRDSTSIESQNIKQITDVSSQENISSDDFGYSINYNENIISKTMGRLRQIIWPCISRHGAQGYKIVRQEDFVEEENDSHQETHPSKDWWTKYYSSFEEKPFDDDYSLMIFNEELENVEGFDNFQDWCQTISFKSDTSNIDAESGVTGELKLGLKVYRSFDEGLLFHKNASTNQGLKLEKGFFHNFPSNSPQHFLVRLYIIRCFDLAAADFSGLADPYLKIKTASTYIDDCKNYQRKTLDPVFGRVFDIKCWFPLDCELKVSVWDHDVASSDDLIGVTAIDLENRFYSKHGAGCGLPKVYTKSGFNVWRHPKLPSEILQELCKRNYIDGPQFFGNESIIVNGVEYKEPIIGTDSEVRENLCLNIVRHWENMPRLGYKMVPEHVETRHLYQKKTGNQSQGRIQMWVDIFPLDGHCIMPAVDISLRQPEDFELRVIVWNIEDVELDEYDVFTGTRVSDIYVKAWLVNRHAVQKTDVHYRSITGEGNFNWRMIFKFKYLRCENKVIEKRRDFIFSQEYESREPPKLFIEVLDNDTLSKDDFLGSLVLDLHQFPRGSKTASECSLSLLEGPVENLFEKRQTKAWWPVQDSKGQKLTGKLELELHLLTKGEALEFPVGRGRKPPEALPKPERPDAAFSWLSSPWRGLRYMVLHRGRRVCVWILISLILGVIIASAVVAMPKYIVKKMMGA